MTKELWINLPVKNISRSKEFFRAIGFELPDSPGNTDSSAVLKVGTKGIIVMLFQEEIFKGITRNGLTDTTTGTEVIFSFDLESRDEVDYLAKKVTDAGGDVFAPPANVQGWMYGCAFTDLDGHRWNGLYMDKQ